MARFLTDWEEIDPRAPSAERVLRIVREQFLKLRKISGQPEEVVLNSPALKAEDGMPVEREDQEPNEKLPPGYRNLTPSEREKLKRALSDRSEWGSKERDKMWRGLEATFKIHDLRARDVQLGTIEQRLSEMEKWKNDVDEMRAKWFRLGALAAMLPILIIMLYVVIRY